MRTRTAIVCAAAFAILLPTVAAAATKRVAVPEIGSPTPVAVMTGHGKIHIEAKPRANEGLLAFAKRLFGSSRHSSALSRANGGVRRLKRGVRYKVPFDLLPERSQQAAIRALLPKDQATAEGWKHQVASSSRSRDAESLWSIAEWFTGAGEKPPGAAASERSDKQRHPAGTGDPRPAPHPRRTLRRHVARGRAPDGGHPLQ